MFLDIALQYGDSATENSATPTKPPGIGRHPKHVPKHGECSMNAPVTVSTSCRKRHHAKGRDIHDAMACSV
jgi:hypothetical protein